MRKGITGRDLPPPDERVKNIAAPIRIRLGS
jgi:hypothetical protein